MSFTLSDAEKQQVGAYIEEELTYNELLLRRPSFRKAADLLTGRSIRSGVSVSGFVVCASFLWNFFPVMLTTTDAKIDFFISCAALDD